MYIIVDQNKEPITFPYWTSAKWQKFGKKKHWSLEELLELPLTISVKKRLPGLKEGTILHLYSTGRYESHQIRKMSDEEIEQVNTLKNTQSCIKETKESIRQKAPELHEELSVLEKRLYSQKKKLKKAKLL